MKPIYVLKILLFIAVILSVSTGCTDNPLDKIELPIHPKAISPKHLNDKPVKGAKAVVYYVESEFPAKEITTYYETELSKMGYLPTESKIEKITRQWVALDQKTLNTEQVAEPPANYLAEWVDQKKETFVWLYVGYRYDGMDKTWKRKPLVNCNIIKYSEYLKGLEEIRRLTN